jgi:NAD(P)-dependent dehydrogenase (short-subunit alcohol dehydrogenase family)
MLLSGRHAVVTGAAGGIGAAIVRILGALGATVYGLDRDLDRLECLEKESGASSQFIPCAVDLADRAGSDRVLGQLHSKLSGRCDILVNNAGVSCVRSFAESDDALLDQLLGVNFIGAFRLTRALLPALRASAHASIVNLGSELALVGQSGYAAYSGSKGAVVAWSRALAVELAPAKIRVNVVCPGPIDTAMLNREFDLLPQPKAARAAEIGSIPLGRLGTPADVAAVVAFLAGDAAAFVTGAVWSVDGGKTSQ